MTVTLVDVSHCFATSWVLLHVSLNIPAGACVLLTGDNGAGKTTLLRIMAKALQPTHGQVEWPTGLKNASGNALRVGLMTHQHYLYEALTALQNLRMVQRLLTKTPPQASLLSLLEQVDLREHANVQVTHFSAGMKRRLALARLLLIDPALILLDEPFGQLDATGIGQMQQLIGHWHKQQKTVVLCTHDVDKAQHLCTWHLHLSQGRAAFAPIQESVT